MPRWPISLADASGYNFSIDLGFPRRRFGLRWDSSIRGGSGKHVLLVLTVLLALHLACMHVAAAGPLLCLVLQWRQVHREDALAGAVGRRLVQRSLEALLVGTLLGIAAGWVLANSNGYDLSGAVRQLSYKIYWGVAELVFYVACVGLYWRTWQTGRRSRPIRIFHGFLAVMASTNLLYHFPPLLTIFSLASRGALPTRGPIDAHSFRQLLVSGEIAAKSLHFVGAAFVVTGIAVMWLAHRESRIGSSPQSSQSDAQTTIRLGAWFALLATFVQFPLGVWIIAELPIIAQQRLLGLALLDTGLIGSALVLSLLLMHHLAAAAWGETQPGMIRRCVLLVSLVVLLMTGTMLRAKLGHELNHAQKAGGAASADATC